MAYSALAGDMKTKITIKSLTQTQDDDGYPQDIWTDLFGAPVWCKWVNANGQELFEGMRLDLREPATITMRYSGKVDVRCVIFRETDPNPYEVISINDVVDGHKFLEIRVQRKVKG